MTVAEIEPEPRELAGIALLSSLERLGAATATSLDLPEGLTFSQYESLGTALGRAHRTVAWFIADWILHGEKIFPQRYAQAVEATNLKPETLMNYASVAKRVPRERRRAGLPFGVHAEVAALSPREQTMWLDRAEQNNWKRDELREAIRPRDDLTPALGTPEQIEQAARELVQSGEEAGDNILVGRASFFELCRLLQEEC